MRDLAGVQSRDGIPTAKNIIFLNWSPSPEPLKKLRNEVSYAADCFKQLWKLTTGYYFFWLNLQKIHYEICSRSDNYLGHPSDSPLRVCLNYIKIDCYDKIEIRLHYCQVPGVLMIALWSFQYEENWRCVSGSKEKVWLESIPKCIFNQHDSKNFSWVSWKVSNVN